jgi:transcriptional regulator with XRE-family HTH domain
LWAPTDDPAVQQSPFAAERKAELGARIRARRDELGWSQETLAERAGGRHRNYISDIERGRVNLSFDNLVTIACALGVDVGMLLTGIY